MVTSVLAHLPSRACKGGDLYSSGPAKPTHQRRRLRVVGGASNEAVPLSASWGVEHPAPAIAMAGTTDHDEQVTS